MSEDEHAIGYQVAPRGTPVEASDGAQVGTLEKALDHGREHLLDGIVIKTASGKKFVDAPEVERFTNLRVILTIDAAAVEALPPYKGVLGSVGERASMKTRRFRRRR